VLEMNRFYLNRERTKLEAWIDLLFLANFQDNELLIGYQTIPIKRGQFLTSEVKLAERWNWSRGKVRRYLQYLEDEKMLIKNSTTAYTTLTIVKYEDYQSGGTTSSTTKSQPKANEKPQLNKEERKKKEKDIYIKCQHMSMTKEDYDKLSEKFGEQNVKDKIEFAENYKKLSNYVNLYATLNNWLKADVKRGVIQLATVGGDYDKHGVKIG